jgi:hypothetical protein
LLLFSTLSPKKIDNFAALMDNGPPFPITPNQAFYQISFVQALFYLHKTKEISVWDQKTGPAD